MIWLDVTKSAEARHKSGLTRVTQRLAQELGPAASAHRWGESLPAETGREALYLTAEVFAPHEREGFAEWVRARPVKLGAIYHDAIPLRLPHVTWPQAVARHPAYLSMLADFDRVWAVSEASRQELLGFWRWQGRAVRARVDVIALGADLNVREPHDDHRLVSALPGAEFPRDEPPLLLCVGIVEPRKRQDFLLGVAEGLWTEGFKFQLKFVGRVNPHFGREMAGRIRPHWLGSLDDAELSRWYRRASACVLPTIAEGCGLPLLEALWHGTPCIASDLPSLRENAAGGGCVLVAPDDAAAWGAALRQWAGKVALREQLIQQARARTANLPTWASLARGLAS